MRRRKGRDPAKLRGGQRMREFGYKLVAVWIDQAERVILQTAACQEQKRLATFVRWAAVQWCKEHASKP